MMMPDTRCVHDTRLPNREYREQMQQLKLSGEGGGGLAAKPGQVYPLVVSSAEFAAFGNIALTLRRR